MSRRLLERLQSPGELARLISLVENRAPGYHAVLRALPPRAGHARRIGVTGPPGAGKSTLVQAMTQRWRARGQTVAIVAVDPSSPLTGGALLGDRIRMQPVALDPGVYIRSMATRGAAGGIAAATRDVCTLLEAAGYDRIVVETVGVGQTELAVARTTDLVVLVLVPESGDSIQALKAGVAELAEIIVVNKADRPGADRMARDLEDSLDLARRTDAGMPRPVVRATVATEGRGVEEVVHQLEQRLARTPALGNSRAPQPAP